MQVEEFINISLNNSIAWAVYKLFQKGNYLFLLKHYFSSKWDLYINSKFLTKLVQFNILTISLKYL